MKLCKPSDMTSSWAHPSRVPFSSLTPASCAQSLHFETAIFRFTPTPKLRGPLSKGSSLGSSATSACLVMDPGSFQPEEKTSLDTGDIAPFMSPAGSMVQSATFRRVLCQERENPFLTHAKNHPLRQFWAATTGRAPRKELIQGCMLKVTGLVQHRRQVCSTSVSTQPDTSR